MTSLIKSKNGSAKIDRFTKPDSGTKKKLYDKTADLFFRGEHPERSEPKTKRVLTELEKEFWFGATEVNNEARVR